MPVHPRPEFDAAAASLQATMVQTGIHVFKTYVEDFRARRWSDLDADANVQISGSYGLFGKYRTRKLITGADPEFQCAIRLYLIPDLASATDPFAAVVDRDDTEQLQAQHSSFLWGAGNPGKWYLKPGNNDWFRLSIVGKAEGAVILITDESFVGD
jgi:hypothetical protein